ncbi:hypothetical protein MJO28_010981 [Puccinia striiformis f. sp. tritici]|uniref:Uncharacterized protein n=1 Tax=Puccinia striiformis f. sp. tritici TaxID=168172 RepID=A0ACC0E0X5_9BASI|nr:hypothetical protein MJO28_010981 [Puccinia striiformis f. sp. tritici]
MAVAEREWTSHLALGWQAVVIHVTRCTIGFIRWQDPETSCVPDGKEKKSGIERRSSAEQSVWIGGTRWLVIQLSALRSSGAGLLGEGLGQESEGSLDDHRLTPRLMERPKRIVRVEKGCSW